MRITGELAGFAETTIADATRVLVNARRYIAAHPDTVTGGLTALVGRLSVTIERAGQVVAQTRTRLAGDLPPSATRLVSMHDPDARPIAKGRLGKPVEFGYKAQVTDNIDGIVLDHSVHVGNPADGPLLVPAIKRIAKRFGLVPAAVTSDRGYGDSPGRGRPHRTRRRDGRDPPQGQAGSRPAATSNSAPVPPPHQVAHRRPKAGSATSNAGSGGTAPCSPPSTAPKPGAASASSPTTASKSPT